MPLLIDARPQLFSGDAFDQAWSQLRTLRSDPPGAAAGGARRSVFGAALEQSEQLFRGAAQADNAVRPLLVFYGMSQACRAIAASASCLDADWRITGHGLHAPGLDKKPLEAMRVRPDTRPRQSALATMQRVLGSPLWTKPLTFAEIWAANPALGSARLPGPVEAPALRFGATHARPKGLPDEIHFVISEIPTDLVDCSNEAALVDLFERRYPSLSPSQPLSPATVQDERFSVRRSMPLHPGVTFEAAVSSMSVQETMEAGRSHLWVVTKDRPIRSSFGGLFSIACRCAPGMNPRAGPGTLTSISVQSPCCSNRSWSSRWRPVRN